MKKIGMKKAGFTLIEMSIVLVIISLLIGGVIKGQELIDSAKVKNLANDFKQIPVLLYGYQDKYRALPADDKAGVTHVTATANGNGDGIIGGNWNDSPTATTPSEAAYFWQYVRLASLTTGNTNLSHASYIPNNAVGGIIGVQSGTSSLADTPIKDSAAATAVAIRGTYVICSAGIVGKYAKQLDILLDDGNSATGAMMAGSATAAGTPMVAAASWTENASYTVCMGV